MTGNCNHPGSGDPNPPRTDPNAPQLQVSAVRVAGSHTPSPHEPSRRSVLWGRFQDELRRRWITVLVSCLLTALAGFSWGYSHAPRTVWVQLLPNDAAALMTLPGTDDALLFKRGHSVESLREMIQSPLLFDRVAAAMTPPVTGEDVRGMVMVDADEVPDRIRVRIRGRDSDHLLNVARMFGTEAVRYAKELHDREIQSASSYLSNRMAQLEASLKSVGEDLSRAQQSMGPEVLDAAGEGLLRQFQELDSAEATTQVQRDTIRLQMDNLLVEIRKHHPALLQARQELDRALLRFTDEHPQVQELKATLKLVESKLDRFGIDADPAVALHGSSLAQNLYAEVIQLRTRMVALTNERAGMQYLKNQLKEKLGRLPADQAAYATLKAGFDSLTRMRHHLIQRQQEIQLLAAEVPGYLRMLQAPRVQGNLNEAPLRSGLGLGCLGGLAGLIGSMLVIGVGSGLNRRVQSAAELSRLTGLPVLATLGNLEAMDEQSRDQWAFATFAKLKGLLTASRHESFVCGFLSSTHGEGRSTWVRMLANAARKRGYRVLTISAGPTGSGDISEEDSDGLENLPTEDQVVTIPSELTKSLTTTTSQPMVNIQPLDWVWDLKCREQWQEALRKCRSVDNLVVLVDLPPASEEETFLLSEDLSQVIWLCGQDMADANRTIEHIQMLNYSRTGLVGAVMNRTNPVPPPRSTRRRTAAALLLAVAGLAMSLPGPNLLAQEPVVTTPGSPGSPLPKATLGFSVTSPAQIAPWQERLTVGPGDLLDISIYEKPETVRNGVSIGPDGRLTYLLAQDVPAADLTIEELREKIAAVLIQKGYRPPVKVIVVPRAFNSKKYYLLGNVIRTGVFPLSRPMTLIEGIAQAGGFVSAPAGGNTLMMADLSRSFLIRKDGTNGFEKLAVNFENLFLRGDLTQNISLAPEDYLYFPPMDLAEVYVLGDVPRPGVAVHTPDMTVMRAIVSQGGFLPQAYRQRVLVVRGSLNVPEKFVVNVSDILYGASPDFKLEPRDIIYVSRKPWAFAEELVELAINEFLRAAVTSWTGQNVGPFIKEPFIK